LITTSSTRVTGSTIESRPSVAPGAPRASTYSRLSPPTVAAIAPAPVSGIESGAAAPAGSSAFSQLGPVPAPGLTTKTRPAVTATAAGAPPTATVATV